LLRRVKKQKTDEAMDIASVEQWCQDLLGEVARSPVAPEDEIHEARAEIIEMINAKLWSSEPGECLNDEVTKSVKTVVGTEQEENNMFSCSVPATRVCSKLVAKCARRHWRARALYFLPPFVRAVSRQLFAV
jgi:hypothetical protein